MGSTRSQKTVMRRLLEELIHGAPKFEPTAKVNGQKVVYYIVVCEPDLARRMIEHGNIGNRKVRQNKVLEFARYMRRGDWMIKGTMEFFESGRIHDGQHRLLACAEAGVPVPFLVQIFPDREKEKTSPYTGLETPRNLADYLHFNGVIDAYRTAPFLVCERNDRVCQNPLQPVKGERSEYLQLYEEIGEEAIKRTYEDIVPPNMYRKMSIQRAFIDWFAFETMQIDAEAAALFLLTVNEPARCKSTDPAFVLNQMLKELAGKRRQRRAVVTLVEQAVPMVKAWNLEYQHLPATPQKLRYRMNEDWPGLAGAVR